METEKKEEEEKGGGQDDVAHYGWLMVGLSSA